MKVRTSALFLALALAAVGCGTSSRVSGRVTCQGQPVTGSILFSPLGEGANNTGPAVTAALNDGNYALQLKTTGKHRVVVSPADRPYPARPGQEYPCDLAPQVQELKAGANTLDIALPPRGP